MAKSKKSLTEKASSSTNHIDKKKFNTEVFEGNEKKGTAALTFRSKTVRTLEGALEVSSADLSIWEVERWLVNKWDMGSKLTLTNPEGEFAEQLAATELWQVKVWFRRKTKDKLSIESLLESIAEKSKPFKLPKRRKKSKEVRRALEIDVMDPHLGLDCQLPESDQRWTIEICKDFYLFAVQDLIEKAASFGPFERVVWVFGNDYLHTDTDGATTRGTPQAEGRPQLESAWHGEQLAIQVVELILSFWGSEIIHKDAILEIKQVPGNHDELSSYMLGRILNAWFRNDQRIVVDAEPTPFKNFHFGINLIGFEHGHNISPIRMAALMANEWRDVWAETSFHEWHCGDQHRKGSSKPCTFEEQGVSIEYLAGLVAPNAWHKKKSFNFQKRAANAFVYDYETGCEAKITTNICKYTGRILTRKPRRKSK